MAMKARDGIEPSCRARQDISHRAVGCPHFLQAKKAGRELQPIQDAMVGFEERQIAPRQRASLLYVFHAQIWRDARNKIVRSLDV